MVLLRQRRQYQPPSMYTTPTLSLTPTIQPKKKPSTHAIVSPRITLQGSNSLPATEWLIWLKDQTWSQRQHLRLRMKRNSRHSKLSKWRRGRAQLDCSLHSKRTSLTISRQGSLTSSTSIKLLQHLEDRASSRSAKRKHRICLSMCQHRSTPGALISRKSF